MAVKDESLIEIAKSVVLEKKNTQTIQSIAEETFKRKGIKFNEKSEEYAQFISDFMLCGDFIYCKDNLWDLKFRQPKSLQDSEGALRIHSQYEEEEERENSLKDEPYDDFNNEEIKAEEYNEDADEDEDEEEKKDDIEEELAQEGYLEEDDDSPYDDYGDGNDN